MTTSLQEQLLKSGLINNNQAKKVNSDKRKKTKLERKNKVKTANQTQVIAQQMRAEKTAKDRNLNQQRQIEVELKAVAAQIRQLVKLNRQPQDENGDVYRFEDQGKIKQIYVSEITRNQLVRGSLAIVKVEKRYEIIPSVIAAKIRLRNEKCILVLNEDKQPVKDENDPYADYQIPDDILW